MLNNGIVVCMVETHEDHENLFRDDNMLEDNAETTFVSTPSLKSYNTKNQRVLAKYNKGEWDLEAQVRVDNEWYVSRRTVLQNPPEEEQEYTALRRPVRINLRFIDLSKAQRIILAPVLAFQIFYYYVKGEDMNIQILDEENN